MDRNSHSPMSSIDVIWVGESVTLLAFSISAWLSLMVRRATITTAAISTAVAAATVKVTRRWLTVAPVRLFSSFSIGVGWLLGLNPLPSSDLGVEWELSAFMLCHLFDFVQRIFLFPESHRHVLLLIA